MAENSKISWTTHTFNPWHGCTEVSPGCDHCYAKVLDHRYKDSYADGPGHWGDDARLQIGEAEWRKILKWDEAALAGCRLDMVFCGSMMDICEGSKLLVDRRYNLVSGVSTEHLRQRVFRRVTDSRALIWLFLTKRPGSILSLLPGTWDAQRPWNVWWGTSIENQDVARGRIRSILDVASRGYGVFLSIEPLLGPLSLPKAFLNLGRRAWVIVGGESGDQARPMHAAWVWRIYEECKANGLPFFFKQWGRWGPIAPGEPWKSEYITVTIDGVVRDSLAPLDRKKHPIHMRRLNKLEDGHTLIGRTVQEFPPFSWGRP